MTNSDINVVAKIKFVYERIENCFNFLPNDKILDPSKLKAFAEDKINVTQKLKI